MYRPLLNQQPLERILQSQGFGSRKECRHLIEAGHVKVNELSCENPSCLFSIKEELRLEIKGKQWIYRERVYILMNKPAGYECSRSPQHHSSIFTLLPAPFIQRGVQCVGRLDQDTTGLLLFTDDGQWLHALTSPRRHVEKTYRVTVKHAITQQLVDGLLSGVHLRDEDQPISALACSAVGANQLDLTIAEGKYHQVKRMIAAAGNRVERLHRVQMGKLTLPDDVAEGAWRDLTLDEQGLCTHTRFPP